MDDSGNDFPGGQHPGDLAPFGVLADPFAAMDPVGGAQFIDLHTGAAVAPSVPVGGFLGLPDAPAPGAAAGLADDEATDTEGGAPAPPPAPVQAPAPAPPPAPVAAPKKRGGGRGGIITLRDLINDGIIEPGEDVLTVEYKGNTHVATLQADGRIACSIGGQDLAFDSPSAFSIYLKRLVNPTRKADDGWKTVKYRGRLLEYYKAELARRRLGLEGDTEVSAALAALGEARAAKRPRTDGPREPKFKFGAGAAVLASGGGVDRPRRLRRAPPRFAAIGVDDEHALQPLEAYAPGEQPFTVAVHPAAEAVMDFHAHLCMNEVIGMLAGRWDPAARRIDVIRAYPVQELATEDDAINVEMDPEDQVAVMAAAEAAGLRPVGWYHSHPTFQAIPSTIDIYNQVLQQHAHREGGEAPPPANGAVAAAAPPPTDAAAPPTPPPPEPTPWAEPYVAAIVSPYDRAIAGPSSSINWFYVAHAPGAVPAEGQRPDEVGCVGKALATHPVLDPLGPQLENLTALQREMERLAQRYAQLPDRANLEAPWADGALRAEKLVASVVGRLRGAPLDAAKLATFADKVLFSTRAVWNVYGKSFAGGSGLAAAAAAAGAPASAAASGQEGAPAAGGEGEGAAGGAAPPPAAPAPAPVDADEPISDADATDDDA